MSDEKLSKIELIKRDGQQLRGTISEALADGSNKFDEANMQQLKFHGVYQQDDRDLRKTLQKAGQERHYTMMIRARIPGGMLSANQYLAFDDLADRFGNGTMRITTRQTFQLHGVLKGELKATIQALNERLVTTLGGCGDQVRNIMTCAKPRLEAYAQMVRQDLLALTDRLSAKTHAYHEIWLDGEKVELAEADTEEEPLYGRLYLPRKFKLGFAFAGDNCSDVYSNDIGIVAHLEDNEISGYTLLIGGGMGRTASDKETHPRLASEFAFVTRDQLVDTCEAIVKVQRDYGNREQRKFARMKYLVEKQGLTWFRQQVGERLGHTLMSPRKLVWTSFQDHLGWHVHDGDRQGFLGLFIENGRIRDTEQVKLKSVLREILCAYPLTIHLTTQQNLILQNIRVSDYPRIAFKLRQAGVALREDLSLVRQNAMACPAMPTCGLAIAESERALPAVLANLEQVLHQHGLAQEALTVRMTGCANGCARPYIADIGFVGRVLGKYDIFLGANALGTRLNQLFLEQVPVNSLVPVLQPLLVLYAKQRNADERFGDFCNRLGMSTLRELAAWPS